MATFRIFIADDHEVVRKGLMSLLQAQPDWEVCGEAADGREAVDKAQQLKPDVVILDIGMPSLNGLEATRQILKSNPQAKVLILTLHDSDQVVREVLNAGARGFLLKSDAARDLVAAVEALRRDKTYFTSKVAAMVLEGYLKGGTADSPRARSRATVGRGKEYERGRGCAGIERENRRNSSLQHHAETAAPLRQRPGSLRGSEQHSSRGTGRNRIDSGGCFCLSLLF